MAFFFLKDTQITLHKSIKNFHIIWVRHNSDNCDSSSKGKQGTKKDICLVVITLNKLKPLWCKYNCLWVVFIILGQNE